MKKNSLLFAGVAFLILLCSAAMAGESFHVGDYLRKNVVERKLENGITVILLNRGYSPTLATNIAFRVGSVDESYETIGAAHMLEHMLFKGTEKLGTTNYKEEKKILDKIESLGETLTRLKNEHPENSEIPKLEGELKKLQQQQSKYALSAPYSRLYSANGGIGFNASTSRDKTGYYIELPSDKLELWAQIESEKLKHAVFREYYRERDNVMEERLMRYDSGGMGFLYEKFFAAAFMAHPYRHPTIGWKSNIENMSLNDVRAFFHRYYIPSRMTIAVVGKQNVEKTFRIIKKYFGDIEYRPEPGEVKTREPEQTGEKRIEVSFRSKPSIIIGWKKPTYPNRSDYAFDILGNMLGDGHSSWLYKTLVLEKKLAVDIGVWAGGPGARYDNLFMIIASPAKGVTPEKLEREIYAEMKNFRKNMSPEDFARVKNATEASFVFMLDSNAKLASSLAFYQTVFKNWKYMTTYLDSIGAVTMDDIRGVFDRYFVKKHRVVGILKDTRSEKK